MIILGLNSLKSLHITVTENNYKGEDKFEKVRVVVSDNISEHDTKDCSFECFVYSINEDGKEIFNNCIPIEFTECNRNTNSNYSYEFELDRRYTCNNSIGFYFNIYYDGKKLGKTNAVKTSFLKHKSDDINLYPNGVDIFEKYKNDMRTAIDNCAPIIKDDCWWTWNIDTHQYENTGVTAVGVSKTESKVAEPSKYIYFKKECENWDTPRIYFWNDRVDCDGLYSQDYSPFTWDEAPYMELNEDGYYYYPLPKGYKYVKFFCDNKAPSYFNYQTNDLIIPSSDLYNSPLYVQSEIGFDGFWANYDNKKTKLIFQEPVYSQLDESNNETGYSYFCKLEKVSYILEDDKEVEVKPLFLGKSSVHKHMQPHYYIELPIDYKQVNFTYLFLENQETKTFQVHKNNLCYNNTCVYVCCNPDLFDYKQAWYFDATRDRILYSQLTQPSCYSELIDIHQSIHNLQETQSSFMGIIESGYVGYGEHRAEQGHVRAGVQFSTDIWYTKVANVVILSGILNIQENSEPNKWKDNTSLDNTTAIYEYLTSLYVPFAPTSTVSSKRYELYPNSTIGLNVAVDDEYIKKIYFADKERNIIMQIHPDGRIVFRLLAPFSSSAYKDEYAIPFVVSYLF